jgi:GT2 family glycosyltransferase
LRGDEQWLGYLDDDILFEAGSLSQLVQTCEQEGLAGACGVVTDARQNTAAYRIFKRLLFRGIFNDPRALPPDARELVPSPVLSGGLTVYRRDAYLRCADSLRHFSGYSWGEDFELSYCVSALGRLAIDPSVRVRNAASSIADLDPAEIALARLQRYRLFAQRTARERIEWVHYLGVLLGVLVVGVRAGAGRQIWLAVGREALATLSRLARPRTATES